MRGDCTVDGCDAPLVARGWCRKHYSRWYKATPRQPRPTLSERFWSKVEKTDGCWLWVKAKTPAGYGVFTIGTKNVPAHRWAYEELVGLIPEGLQIDHLCRVRNCVNPAHLEPVTSRENTLRGIGPAAINAAKTHCVHGHEYTPENTYTRSNGTRACKACDRKSQRRRKAAA